MLEFFDSRSATIRSLSQDRKDLGWCMVLLKGIPHSDVVGKGVCSRSRKWGFLMTEKISRSGAGYSDNVR